MANPRARRGARKARPAAVATGEPGADPQQAAPVYEAAGRVLVLKRGKRRKKRKYTRGLKDVQRLERRVVRATDRVADAVAAGLDTFRRRDNRSSRKKRDGAIRDVLGNLSRGAGKTLRRASKAPWDLTRSGGILPWRQVRGVVSLATAPLASFWLWR